MTGIWRATDPYSSVWFELPKTAYGDKMWVPMETFRRQMTRLVARPIFYVSWYVVVDDAGLRFERAPEYARALVQMGTDLQRILPDVTTDYTPLEALNTYRERAETLTTLFYAVGGPMIVLALLFISLTANIAVQQYEQETATMRGRGTSWMQVAALNIIESVALILMAIPFALVVGWLAALVMGKTLSFLQFTNRAGLDLSLRGINVLWLGLAAILIILARFAPILSISRTSIVRIKQERSRAVRKPFWERFYLDFILLLPGIYAYVTLSGMAKPVRFLEALQPTPGEQYRDPLMFIAPALFAMALCMILLRVLPFILKLLAHLSDNTPRVWAFLSLQQVARSPRDHSAALLLVMMSLSLAIYSASTAKTLDKWLYDSAYYQAGTDLVVSESMVDSGSAIGPNGPTNTVSGSSQDNFSIEGLSVEEHLKLSSVTAATRVGMYEGTFSYGVGEDPATFMGIDRLEFPKVAFFRDDFASESLGALMNALAVNPDGVIVPQDMLNEMGLRVGDGINVAMNIGDQAADRQMTIVGTYQYWPTVFPSRKPTMIVNLNSIFDNPDAAVGYDVWMKLKAGTDVQGLLNDIRYLMGADRAVVRVQGNAYDSIREMMDQPERVGLFGVLNVGFIATGLMPGIGFLLYSYASLRRRFIQLGILQAIGLSTRQLINYLVLEQCLLMGVSILTGAAVGLLTSRLFVPFLQIGASREAPVPPFDVLIGWGEFGCAEPGLWPGALPHHDRHHLVPGSDESLPGCQDGRSHVRGSNAKQR